MRPPLGICAVSLLVVVMPVAGCTSAEDERRAGFERYLAESGVAIRLEPSEGRVGHHMVARFKVPGSQLENICPGESSWQGRGEMVGGSLPPGLKFFGTHPLRVEGTPEQPGEWEFTIQWTRIRCSVGGVGGRELPDTTKNHSLKITGDAPRRVR
jgi:hypothetical protein